MNTTGIGLGTPLSNPLILSIAKKTAASVINSISGGHSGGQTTISPNINVNPRFDIGTTSTASGSDDHGPHYPHDQYYDVPGLPHPGSHGLVPFSRIPRGHMGQEEKFFDSGLIATTVGVALIGSLKDPATKLCLNSPGSGAGESERVGRRILMTHLQIRGRVQMISGELQTNPPVGGPLRVVVFMDKQANKAVPVETDFFDVPGVGAEMHAMHNLSFKDRFQTMKDYTFDLEYKNMTKIVNDAYDYSNVSQPFIWNFNLAQVALFQGTGATIASIVTNAIHIMALSVSSKGKIEYNARLRYLNS